ncbi:basic leucine zipper transcriptional factor ATF-like [Triplophysa rosa]|uniref:Basic leucine zipper transcriptional factor ATF-like n=1 Tax=Triplophysa rosa TaxID=992332 RepID=A0A9W7X6M3_TRIRA|nr:basic leucine zipper transcriptional factor ATF-like [Triplophysa rosa]KAI7814608.1 putative basic leucine zipper transcriptional factor ATF-like [Triplophysa rosa]
MPVAFMDNFDRSSPFSQSDSQSPQDWTTEQTGEHKHQRRDKNRDAARKSRRKQTQKADVLHEELQTLEQSNAAYLKEIAELKKELQFYTTALEQHEPHCIKLCPHGPPVSMTVQGCPSTATPPPSDIPDPNPLPLDLDFFSGSPHNSTEMSLTELIDSSEFSPWDIVNGVGYLPQI